MTWRKRKFYQKLKRLSLFFRKLKKCPHTWIPTTQLKVEYCESKSYLGSTSSSWRRWNHTDQSSRACRSKLLYIIWTPGPGIRRGGSYERACRAEPRRVYVQPRGCASIGWGDSAAHWSVWPEKSTRALLFPKATARRASGRLGLYVIPVCSSAFYADRAGLEKNGIPSAREKWSADSHVRWSLNVYFTQSAVSARCCSFLSADR